MEKFVVVFTEHFPRELIGAELQELQPANGPSRPSLRCTSVTEVWGGFLALVPAEETQQQGQSTFYVRQEHVLCAIRGVNRTPPGFAPSPPPLAPGG